MENRFFFVFSASLCAVDPFLGFQDSISLTGIDVTLTITQVVCSVLPYIMPSKLLLEVADFCWSKNFLGKLFAKG